MPRFAANISTMFTDRPFVNRVEAAATAGFKAVECQFPYLAGAAELKARLAACGLPLVLMNTPPGDFAAGERGLAGLPGREADFEAALGEALTYALALECPMIHVMAGVQPPAPAGKPAFGSSRRTSGAPPRPARAPGAWP